MTSTALTRGKLLSIEESVARLAAFRKSHPTRYLGLLWHAGPHAVPRTVFAAPAADDTDLIDQYRVAQRNVEWGYATLVPLGTDGLVADAWLNEKGKR